MVHIDYLESLIKGDKKKGRTSLQFDIDNFNVFYYIQKVHMVVMEIYHLALTENQEDTIHIIHTRDQLIETILDNLGSVSIWQVLEDKNYCLQNAVYTVSRL